MSDDPSEDDDLGRARKNLVAGVVIAVLLVGGWWLMNELQHHREVGDCIASGRHDCVPITPEPGK